MKRLLQNSISIGVVVIVFFLFLPIPAFMIDFLIIVNISVGVMILLISMNISETLEFSIFPSLLLITTLFRLGLNVSTTRLILSESGSNGTAAAGAVIETFGAMITAGNIVIGVVIFLIIVLMQFLVITKGAERVAEVAARFTLDAMPGKQMAIDADLSSGMIDDQEAKLRRYKIQKEADFFGSMDGATKIVKGDATMSLIITAINFVGGLIIGMVQEEMEFVEALEVYCITTIGDGLVSQVPSLMISVATGMIVTRAVSDDSLNVDVFGQFTRQPKALGVTGALLTIMSVTPVPTIPFLAVGSALLTASYLSSKSMAALAVEEEVERAAAAAGGAGVPDPGAAMPTESEYYKDINNVYSLLNVEPIEMEFGYSLIPMVDESTGGKLISRIVIFRRQYAQDMGFVIPSVRLHDSSALGTNEYVIRIKGEEVARGEILVDYCLALEPPNPVGEIDGIETIDPAYGIPSRWILPENKEMAEIYGYTVIDPLSVMQTHLSEVIKKHAHELLTRAETMQLVGNFRNFAPELVDEVVPAQLSFANLEKILKNLLREGIPIKDMSSILEVAAESLLASRDMDIVTENIRGALSRTITRRFCDGGQLRVITLDAEVERKLMESLTKKDQGIYLAMSPDLMQSLVTQIAEHMKKFTDLGQSPVVLTNQVIRVYLSRMLTQFYPSLFVLSFSEITSDVQIQALGNITMQRQEKKKGGVI
ncbi:MAG: flagellar biosynthesis protein FlhA [Eubacteriales bacterium]